VCVLIDAGRMTQLTVQGGEISVGRRAGKSNKRRKDLPDRELPTLSTTECVNTSRGGRGRVLCSFYLCVQREGERRGEFGRREVGG
jgi:hypothetical protein